MIFEIEVNGLGKAYKYYSSKWHRLLEWVIPWDVKFYTEKWIFRNVSFSILKGQAVGLLGVNGAGKSTLLKVLTGTSKASEGSFHLNGRVCALLELGMGFHPDFTGRQNVYMSGQLQGLSRETIDGVLDEVRKFADIGDYFDLPVRVYSSGMQVRLAFAVATAVRPDVLIVDEALSVGDVSFQAKCYRRIKEFLSEGTSLLLVTHSLDDVVKHCGRAMLLESGRIVADGTPREIVNIYRDKVFGRTQVRESSVEKVAENSGAVNLLSEDVFHTRPLYQGIEHRWGSREATISDYFVESRGVLFPNSIVSGDPLVVSFRVTFHVSVFNPIFGLLIKSHDGVVIYATNSSVEGMYLDMANDGEVYDCSFVMPAYFNSGSYLLSLGVSAGSDLTADSPLDRRYDSIMINVVNYKNHAGILSVKSSFSLARSD